MNGRCKEMVLLGALALVALGCERDHTHRRGESLRAPTPSAPRVMVIDAPARDTALAPNVTAHNGSVWLSWLERRPARGAGAGQTPAHSLMVSRLDGLTWTPPTEVTTGRGVVANWADVPVVAARAGGVMTATWPESSGPSGYQYNVRVAARTGEQPWRDAGIAHVARVPSEYGFVSMTGEGPTTRLFWLDGRAMAASAHGHGGAMTLRTAVLGTSVANEQLVDDRVCDCCGTAAATTDAGPVVVYRDRTADEVRDIWIARRVGDTWQRRAVHRDGWRVTGCPVNGPAVAARGMELVVAWYTYAGGTPRVRLAFSRDAGAAFDPPIDVDVPRGSRAPMGRVGVILERSGQAVVSWMTARRETAAIRVRRVAASGRAGRELVLDHVNAGRAAGFPRMARVGHEIVTAWTVPTPRSHIRVARVPLAAIPALDVAGAPARRAISTKPVTTSRIPDVAVRRLDGAAENLRSLIGRPTVLNVWATWCEPCRRELPDLAKLHGQYVGRGLRVVGLSVDQDRTREQIRRFTTRRRIPYEMWHDREDAASSALGVGILPATFVIDAAGRIVWKHSGAIDARDRALHAALEKILAP